MNAVIDSKHEASPSIKRSDTHASKMTWSTEIKFCPVLNTKQANLNLKATALAGNVVVLQIINGDVWAKTWHATGQDITVELESGQQFTVKADTYKHKCSVDVNVMRELGVI